MRIWSIHPRYLDSIGLVAVWREALLAKAVLQGKTRGFKKHPQIRRFKSRPISFINTYLLHIWKESVKRNYKFDKRKIGRSFTKEKIKVTGRQIRHEFRTLMGRLKKRSPKRYKELLKARRIEAHPLFLVKKASH